MPRPPPPHWAPLTRAPAFRWGGFGEAYCAGFFCDLVALLGKRYLGRLGLAGGRAALAVAASERVLGPARMSRLKQAACVYSVTLCSSARVYLFIF